MKKIWGITLSFTMMLSMLTGCGQGKEATNPDLGTEDVTLTIAGAVSENKGLDDIAAKFMAKYPNCKVEYKFVQNYEENITKNLTTDQAPDLFLTNNIQGESELRDNTLELYGLGDKLDISDTFEGMVKNFEIMTTNESVPKELYSVPTGGEIRGLFVNKTFLDKLNLSVPKNRTELLEVCEAIKKEGYTPLQGNPGMFAQRLLYPYICNLIAKSPNYEKEYKEINQCKAGVSELFRDPMQLMYTMMAKDYYDYKPLEVEKNRYTDMSDETTARDFLNIIKDGDDFKKVDDVGEVAFLPGTYTQKTVFDQIKSDYHSAIDYEFIMAPVGADGGYAYMSPASGLAINKNTKNQDWAVEFMNFFFIKENSESYAKIDNLIPDTTDALNYISKKFSVPTSQVTHLGEMTFDYGFYDIIQESLVEVSKGNNPKYMKTDKKGNTSLYDFEYYMKHLEELFAQQR